MSLSVFPLRSTFRTWCAYIGLTVVLSAACFGSLADHLLDTHDIETFRDHIAISKDFSFFFSPEKEAAGGRLVDELVLWLAYTIWGNDPGIFHLLVVFFHTLASLLLAWLFYQLGANVELSFAGGLLFLLNTAHFQAVHWISALEYPLALLCSTAAVLFYVHFTRSHQPALLVGFYCSLAVSTIAHLAAVMIWPFCLYWSWKQGHGLKTILRYLLPFGLLLLPTLVLIFHTMSKEASTWWALRSYASADLLSLLVGMARILLWFSGRLLTTAHWLPIPVYEQQIWELGIGILVLVGLALLMWRKISPVDQWAAWTVLMLLPFLLLTEDIILDLPVGPSRYLYLATAGSSLLLAWGIQQAGLQLACRLKSLGHYLYIASLAALVLFCYTTLKKTEALSFYTSGRSYLASEDTETGIEQLKRAITQGPDVIDLKDTYTRLCLMLMSSSEETRPVLEQALQRFPESIPLNLFCLAIDSMDPDSTRRQQANREIASIRKDAYVSDLLAQAYYNMGRGFEDKNDHERAILAYRCALEYGPEEVKTLKSLTVSLVSAGYQERAHSILRQISQLTPQDPNTVYYSTALALKIEGKTDQAIATCQQALRLQPTAEIFSLLGDCYEQSGQFNQAQKAYQESILRDPDNHQLHLRLANVFQTAGDKTAAIAALEKAMRLKPDDPTIHYNLGNLYYRDRRFARAADAYREAIRLDPQDSQSYANLGTTLRAMDQLREAEQAYRSAVQLHPDNPVFYHNLGGVLLQQGDAQNALQAFQQAVQFGSQNVDTYLALSRLFQEAGQQEEALRIYRRILESDFQDASGDVYTKMGIELFERGRIDDSTRAYRKALEKDGENLTARINLGWNLYLTGDLDAAIGEYRRVLTQQTSSVALFNLGLAYLAKGDIEKARETYARSVAEFGTAEAEKIGAVDDLKDLIARGIRAAEAQEILNAYWKQ